ncbi:hypothetical protein [uncultured Methanobrevibacter sp.]|uniref:hypothetical protein n=1 Tax=uncultured Methanobrevibacter sp. TaxID=253161 RepID=UPI0026253990|nr:hypothetical protein [uncultured Methanobrevibacter sp.]
MTVGIAFSLFDTTIMVITYVIICWIFIGNLLVSVGIGMIIIAVLVGTVLEHIVKGFKMLTGCYVDLKQLWGV